MNTKRTPTYIKLLHSIRSCKDHRQIESLTLHIIDYANHNKDGEDLMLEYRTKKLAVSVELDYLKFSIDSLHHQRVCGGH